MYTYISKSMYACIHIYMYNDSLGGNCRTTMVACVSQQVYTYTCICIYIYIDTYTYMYIYIRIYI